MFLLWLVVAVLCLIGVLALAYKLVDTFWSLAQLIGAHLKPYFQPGEESSFIKKYGPWAGEFAKPMFPFSVGVNVTQNFLKIIPEFNQSTPIIMLIDKL